MVFTHYTPTPPPPSPIRQLGEGYQGHFQIQYGFLVHFTLCSLGIQNKYLNLRLQKIYIPFSHVRSFEIPRGREVLFSFCHTPGYGTSILRREHSRKSTGLFPEQQRVLKPREVSKVLMESMVSYMICVLYAKLDLIWIKV